MPSLLGYANLFKACGIQPAGGMEPASDAAESLDEELEDGPDDLEPAGGYDPDWQEADSAAAGQTSSQGSASQEGPDGNDDDNPDGSMTLDEMQEQQSEILEEAAATVAEQMAQIGEDLQQLG